MSTYSHEDDLIFKHGLSLEINSSPQSNDTIIIAKSISNHRQHNQAKGKQSNLDYTHGDHA